MALVAGGGLSFPLLIGALALASRSSPLSTLAILTGTFFGHLGAASLALAGRDIVRPDARWARGAQLGLTAIPVVALAARVRAPAAIPSPDYVFWPGMFASLASYAWSAFESFRLWSMMRRRVALGLGDPALAHRFLLWGGAAAAACRIVACTMINCTLHPTQMHPTWLLAQTVFDATAADGIGLAFFPLGRRRASPRQAASTP